jgi:hypothetical protein
LTGRSSFRYAVSNQYCAPVSPGLFHFQLNLGATYVLSSPTGLQVLVSFHLSQTLVQTIHLAQDEYINALGTDGWRGAVRNSVQQNFEYASDSAEPEPQSTPPQKSLESTPIEIPASVDSKPLTQSLSPLDATLTENQGEG